MLEPLERLRNAVIEGNLPITKRLLIRFPDLWLNVDTVNKGWNNLHYASFNGNYLICSHLVSFIEKSHTDYSLLDLLTFDNLLVLHVATINNNHQVLHYLLQDFGKPWLNHLGGPLLQLPLHYSCIHNFKRGVKLLLDFGADYNLQDSDGNTCFHLCFQYNNLECLHILLKYILSNPDRSQAIATITSLEGLQNYKGWSSFDYASTFKFIDTYKQLKSDLITNERNEVSDIDQISLGSSLLNLSFNKSVDSFESTSQSTSNKILSSPIISLTKRSHSQSLPPPYNEMDTLINAPRERSNTAVLTKPPSISGIKSPMKPSTMTAASAAFTAFTNSPQMNKPQASMFGSLPETPTTNNRPASLKSVTISPSTRQISPQSTISTSSSTESFERSRRKGSFNQVNRSRTLSTTSYDGLLSVTPTPRPRRSSNNLNILKSRDDLNNLKSKDDLNKSSTLLSIDVKPTINRGSSSNSDISSPDSYIKRVDSIDIGSDVIKGINSDSTPDLTKGIYSNTSTQNHSNSTTPDLSKEFHSNSSNPVLSTQGESTTHIFKLQGIESTPTLQKISTVESPSMSRLNKIHSISFTRIDRTAIE